MENAMTNYKSLIGITYTENYVNGNIKACMLNEINLINTKYGTLIPRYSFSNEEYNKHIASLCFYEDGRLKSIYLQNQTNINTPIGTLPAKLVTFYESGNIKSFEPSKPALISTPIGKITTFSSSTLDLTSDINSVNFYESSNLKSLLTSSDKVTVLLEDDAIEIYEPNLKINTENKKHLDVIPLIISFSDNKIQFNNSKDDEYDLCHFNFTIEHLAFSHSFPYKNLY